MNPSRRVSKKLSAVQAADREAYRIPVVTYLEWVDAVLKAAVEATQSDEYRGSIGVVAAQIANKIGVGMEKQEIQAALHTAGEDLAFMGLIEHEQGPFRVGSRGIKVARAGGLRSQWPGVFQQLQPLAEDLAVLRRVVEASEIRDEHWANLNLIELKGVLREMALDATQPMANAIANRLHDDSCLRRPLMTTAWCHVQPTYLGVVLATQREVSLHEQMVRDLVGQWETTSVDVKEVLRLDSEREKAEFCKDVLALANTRVSGRRFIVLGFNNDARKFTTSMDPKVDDHRMESVLSAYCAPVPQIRYTVVALPEGNAGLIEVLSDRAQLPYRLARQAWKYEADAVFVRHNTLVAVAEGGELETLVAEGQRAQGER